LLLRTSYSSERDAKPARSRADMTLHCRFRSVGILAGYSLQNRLMLTHGFTQAIELRHGKSLTLDEHFADWPVHGGENRVSGELKDHVVKLRVVDGEANHVTCLKGVSHDIGAPSQAFLG